VKRAIDVVAAGAGLVALSPVLAAAAIAVKLGSPGPVLFRHARVGKDGRTFEVLTFRSMRVGGAGPAITTGGDPRVTRVGRLLRRTKLDELPQLWNVLVGDMSLVGPRPEVQRYVDRFAGDYARILSIRPGITDFAAVEYRDEESVLAAAADAEAAYVERVLPAKIRLYHRYLDEMSLKTDVSLVLRTLGALFR
jgi:lipopolysaccharide/colanic/teichoic acid biosynthesis glycosyltransferase